MIQNPITELNRKRIFLDRWLKERGIEIPIKEVVGLAYTNELLISEETSTTIAFTHEIPILLYNTVLEAAKLGEKRSVNLHMN